MILWFADFVRRNVVAFTRYPSTEVYPSQNYRIDLDNETARDCASTGDLQTLWEADQVG